MDIHDKFLQHITELGNQNLGYSPPPGAGLSNQRHALLALSKAVEDQRRAHNLSKSDSLPTLNINILKANAMKHYKKQTGVDFKVEDHPELVQALINSNSPLIR